MCVSQFRDYCKASRFATRGSMTSTEETTRYSPYLAKFEGVDGTSIETRLYVTDTKEMQRLAKMNNPYAIKYLRSRA